MTLRTKDHPPARLLWSTVSGWLPPAVAIVAVAIMLLLVAYPLLMVVAQAVYPRLPDLTVGPALRVFDTVGRSPYLRNGLAHSLQLGVGAALVAMVISSPVAFLIERTDLRSRPLLDFLMLLPFTTPPFLSAEVWILILERHGYLQQLTHIDATGAQSFLYSYFGIVAVLALHLFPLVYFAQRSGLALLPGSVIDAARTSGAGWWRTGTRVVLPLMLPATLAGALLVFASSMAEYGAPATLAIQAHFLATSVNIGNLTSQYPTNRPVAAALSIVLLVCTLSALLLSRWLTGRGRYTSRSLTRSSLTLGRWQAPSLALVWAVALFSGIIPWSAVLTTSLMRTLSGGLSWSNLEPSRLLLLLARPEAAEALRTSVELAAVAATAVAVLGGVIGYLIARPGLHGRWLLDGIALLPVATPGVVIAVAVIVVWNQPFMPGAIYESQWVLAIAYTVVFLPFGVRYTSAALQSIPAGVEEAGRMSGAGSFRRLSHLVLPMLYPSLVSAWVLAFAIGMRELENSLIVRPANTTTVSVFIWQSFTQANPLDGMAMAVVTLAVTCVALLSVRALVGQLTTFGK